MEPTGVTWVVVADREQARIFEERGRGGPLRELEAFSLDAADDVEHKRGQATVHDRFGAGRHGSEERSGLTEDDRRFARRVAEALEEASQCSAFDRLAVFAPARTLGLVQETLSRPLSRKLEVTEPRYCVRDDAEAVRGRLRAARLRT